MGKTYKKNSNFFYKPVDLTGYKRRLREENRLCNTGERVIYFQKQEVNEE